MLERVRFLWGLPGCLMLSWKLFRDPRVSIQAKVIAVGAIILIFSPFDLLDWIPGAGGASEVALVVLVLKAFINAAPEEVRAEHMMALGMADV